MHWFKVIFVMILVGSLDCTENEVDEIDDETTTEIAALTTTTRIPPICETKSLIEAHGCINGNDLTLKVHWHELEGDLDITSIRSKEKEKCCDFVKTINNSFVANIDCVDPSCTYNPYHSEYQESLYSLKGSLLGNITSQCPKMEELCVEHRTDCLLANYSVTPVYQRELDFISFNISWNKVDMNESAHIRIITDETYNNGTHCYQIMDDFNRNLMTSYVLLPALAAPPAAPLEPGCAYNISVHSENRHFACGLVYAIPDCLEKRCDCSKFKPKPKILTVEHISKENFLIKWDPGKISVDNRSSYSIDRVDFTLFKKDILFGGESVSCVKKNWKKSTCEAYMQLFDEEKYSLTGTFRNNFSCIATFTYKFTAPTRSSLETIHIALLIVILVVIVVIILKCQTIQKYMHKLLAYVIPSRTNSQRIELPLMKLQNGHFPMNTNVQYTPVEILDHLVDEYEFPRNKVLLKEEIGSGNFGKVYSAKAIGINDEEVYRMVAVKTLGDGGNITKEATNDFIAEIEIFKKIGYHPNIVQLLGCCTIDAPYMMIMEFVPCGDLKNYLVKLRDQWFTKKNRKKRKQLFFPDDSDGEYIDPPPNSPVSITSSRLPSTSETVVTTLEDSPMTPLLADYSNALERVLDHNELQNFALQIAKGMAYLEQIPITHRDLAARNILISENKTLKISDFGLSRSGPYVNHKSQKLPLRWMAIEAIVQHKYDSKSDVWSFGVVLWEIGTLGAFPYEKVPDSFVQQYLQMGQRLERPEICTDELYSLMRQCWDADPDERPTFRDLVDALDVNKKKMYVNFSQLNPIYVFPPSEIERCDENPVRVVSIDI